MGETGVWTGGRCWTTPQILGGGALAAAKRKLKGQRAVLCVAWELTHLRSPVAGTALNQATTRAVTYRWRRSVAQLMIPADDGLWGS